MSLADTVADLFQTPARVDATPGAVLDALANERRRLVVHGLAEATGPIELRTLARAIAAAENDAPAAELTKAEIKRVYIVLYQNHVEVLEGVDAAARVSEDSQAYRAGAATEALDEIAREVQRRSDAVAARDRAARVRQVVADREVVVE